MALNIVPRENGQQNLGTEDKQFGTVYAQNFGGGLAEKMDEKATNVELARVEGLIAFASAPNYFEHDIAFYQNGVTKIHSPNELWININGKGHKLTEAVELDISTHDAWDTNATEWEPSTDYALDDYVSYQSNGYLYKCVTAGTSSSLTPSFPTTPGQTYNDGSVVWECVLDYATAANRHGKDFYIYAIYSDTLVPSLVVSINSTVPEKYDADNSRKIGGFHCLCVDAGTNISDHDNVHPLSGYAAGDILPASVWDLKHRPVSDPEGMAYIEGLDLWVDIYLASYSGAYSHSPEDLRLETKYGAVCADGTSAEVFHCLKFEQVFGRQNKRLLSWQEFVCCSIGSNQGTNVVGGADVNTTGGFKDTAGRRMISNFGLEDCCGNLWQWGRDMASGGTSGSYAAGYTAADKYVAGQIYATIYRPLFGGGADGADGGSRGANAANGALTVAWYCGARGASEPLFRGA